MYRPSRYGVHDETLARFQELFYSCPISPYISMHVNQRETYRDDGQFVDERSGRQIGLDWEYRDRYFKNCRLQFDTLGQYERKLEKPEIQISLQCDETETGIAVGWHYDWLREPAARRSLRTDYAQRENGGTRYTKKFKIYSYSDIGKFKRMLDYALATGTYHCEAVAHDEESEAQF